MLRIFVPRTVVGQLMAMLAIVLLLGQVINLALLVGEQRLQARSKAYNEVIEYSSRLIAQLPDELPSRLPSRLPRLAGGPEGEFFLSQINRAEHRKDIKSLPRYNARFQAMLKDQGVSSLQTSVTFLSNGPQKLDTVSQRVVLENGENVVLYRPPPPRGLYGERRRRPPPRDAIIERERTPLERPPRGKGLVKQDLQEIRLSAEIEPGVWFNAMMPHSPTESLTGRILLATGLLLGLTFLAVWIFARRISRPLSEFTRAAEKLGRGNDPQVLAETGPRDISQAAIAFNRMQTRLTRMLETQRMTLRAVGHDLRTPLTSLRIRAENIPEDLNRDKFIATLDDMTVMTEEILSWAKDASGTEEIASVNLEAMLGSLTDDYQDQGAKVSLTDFESMTVKIRRTSIKRALQNLINNALQYGAVANLSVEYDSERIMIHIEDEGPGVPEDRLADILKPFIRLEASRNKETGGTGLGLSIAESIAQIHGGRLLLSNRKPNGLRATLVLPK